MIWTYNLCNNWLDSLCSHEEKENHLDKDPNSWQHLACSEAQLKGIKVLIDCRRRRMDKLEQLVDKALEFYYSPAQKTIQRAVSGDLMGYILKAGIEFTQEELAECETNCQGQFCPHQGIRCWEVWGRG